MTNAMPFTGRTLLVLGGARSGKSRYAQAMAERSGDTLVFIATAQAFDDEMTDRIAHHRADRDARWRTIEEPLDLAGAITAADTGTETETAAVILVDCLTLWASNILLADADLDAHLTAVARVIAASRGRLLFVANEVGLGIVPDNALARRFRDMAGTINQRIAAIADHVQFLAAGLPIILK